MPKSPKKTTQKKRATLKKLSATTKEVTRKQMKGVKGKGLTTSNITFTGTAPQLTVGVAPQPLLDPKFTVSK